MKKDKHQLCFCKSFSAYLTPTVSEDYRGGNCLKCAISFKASGYQSPLETDQHCSQASRLLDSLTPIIQHHTFSCPIFEPPEHGLTAMAIFMTKATVFSHTHSGSRSYSLSRAEDRLSALNLAHRHTVTVCSPPYLLNSSLQICK